ncbi:MAG: hypothetical protein J6U83_01785 [Bacteroidales bacterium]|nr:hypothetical protein [Bacteroidales bacterium]
MSNFYGTLDEVFLNVITMEKGLIYESPEIEMIEVEIEQGFGMSLTNEGIGGEKEPIDW